MATSLRINGRVRKKWQGVVKDVLPLCVCCSIVLVAWDSDSGLGLAGAPLRA
jgi:hypothetical protein